MPNKRIQILIFAIIIVAVVAGMRLMSAEQDSIREKEQTEITTTDKLIASLEQKTQTDTATSNSYVALANAYMQKVREDADLSLYTKVLELMDTAEKKDQSNGDVFALRAQVFAGRHEFNQAETLIKKAIELNPNKSTYYGTLSECQVELGKYNDAIVSLQKMVDLRPDFSSYSRIAYMRELYGDIEGARDALTKALSAGSVFPENIAWVYVELGKLSLKNNISQAENEFNSALQAVENYPPALGGLAKVEIAKNNQETAIKHLNKAFNKLPIAAYSTDLGDIYKLKNDNKKANQYYELTKIAYKDSEKSGVRTEMEEAMFLADHELDLDTALTKAQKAHTQRPSIFASDALAWINFRKNNLPEAKKYITEALSLGEHDSQILYHAGRIANADGNKPEAKRLLEKSLLLNPNFSILQAKVAKEILTSF